MDDQQEVREYQKMDHQSVNESFVKDLINGGSVGPRVIDLGCGTAEIVVLLCQNRPDVEAMGIDSSIEMLEAARIEIELGGMLGRIHLEHADCKSLVGFESSMADTVISNTMLHHLAEPQKAIAEAIRILAPGGRLFFRDLARPATSDEVEKLVNLHAESESDFARQLLRQSLHAAMTVSEAAAMADAFGANADFLRMTSDRHWTLDWIKPA